MFIFTITLIHIYLHSHTDKYKTNATPNNIHLQMTRDKPHIDEIRIVIINNTYYDQTINLQRSADRIHNNIDDALLQNNDIYNNSVNLNAILQQPAHGDLRIIYSTVRMIIPLHKNEQLSPTLSFVFSEYIL